jgi:hypothetical protein
MAWRDPEQWRALPVQEVRAGCYSFQEIRHD